MKYLGFLPSKADPYIWYRENKDGTKYEYVAIYVDDLLLVSENPKELIDQLKEKFKLKIKGDGPLEYHLGCDYYLDPDGMLVAAPRKYVSKILEAYKNMFGENPKASKLPLDKNNHPELDNSELVGPDQNQKYMTMIGQLQWAVTLGRFDILSQVVSMSRFRLALELDMLLESRRSLATYPRPSNMPSDSGLMNQTTPTYLTRTMIGAGLFMEMSMRKSLKMLQSL
ncbi:hypothetical protein ACA910_000677 [Epithemia clementina (nom. ined.)]